MSNATPSATPEYEFSDQQNAVIGDLARKMSLVGFALMLFGILQIASGITTFISGRNPDRVLAAAKNAGVPDVQLEQLKKALTSDGGWFTPFTIAAISTILVGILLMMVGTWNQQAAGGFAGMVVSKGQDISRSMRLAVLRKKYTLIYNMIMIFAIFSLISLVVSLIHWFKGS